VQNGIKNFELRKNDRDYKVGDYIILQEIDNGTYTNRELPKIKIKYILHGGDFGLKKNYCILGLE
jgi:ParB family chromosome partitioning protein